MKDDFIDIVLIRLTVAGALKVTSYQLQCILLWLLYTLSEVEV